MYDYIIVGGGISGLYCAIHLTNVLVLEKSNVWGGRIKKHYHPNYEGAGRFHKNHKLLWNLIKRFMLHIRKVESTSEYEPPVSIENYILKRIRTQATSNRSFYHRCLSVMGESDAVQFVYAQGYHEMCILNAYDSLHTFNPVFCQDYYVIKEGLNELCLRMVNVIQGKCNLNHTVTKITRVEGHLEVDGYKGKRVIVTIPPALFSCFPILSPYASIAPTLFGPPLLRIYAKYPTPFWFESLEDEYNLIPIHDGIVLIVYVNEEDIVKFTYKGELKVESELCIILDHELSILFPFIKIPQPLWIKPYLWKIGMHGWLPTNLGPLPELDKLYVCGEAFSTRQSWIEGALESAQSTLCKINSKTSM